MSLEETFSAYIGLIETLSASDRPKTTQSSSGDSLRLESLVMELESKPEFQNLMRATMAGLSEDTDESFAAMFWTDNVKAFFRRSGLYLSAHRGDRIDVVPWCRKYLEAFSAKTTRIKYLVPLESVEFDENEMDFGTFRIVQLSQSDLEILLQSDINKVFYPYATADLSNLDGLWFLEIVDVAEVEEPGSGGTIGLRGPEIEVRFSEF